MKTPIILALAVTISISISCRNQSAEAEQSYEMPPEIEQIPIGTQTGLRAPEIELPNLEGQAMRLSDLRGKVVLIDFWAAWCNPCRMENPHLVKTYSKYKDGEFTAGNGFEILSISLDRNETAWREAVQADKINWDYVLGDMKGARTQPAIDYGIQMIPTNFLLDRNGVIIAMNLRGDALEEKLEELKDEG